MFITYVVNTHNYVTWYHNRYGCNVKDLRLIMLYLRYVLGVFAHRNIKAKKANHRWFRYPAGGKWARLELRALLTSASNARALLLKSCAIQVFSSVVEKTPGDLDLPNGNSRRSLLLLSTLIFFAEHSLLLIRPLSDIAMINVKELSYTRSYTLLVEYFR